LILRRTADEDWRHWLRGGFAFESAPFAIHPLDAERAQRCFFTALRAGASSMAVAEEARGYLTSIGCDQDFVRTQIESVKSYFKSIKVCGKSKKAWLVFWNGSDNFVKDQASSLVLAFDPRMSPESVRNFVELHYQAAEYSFQEKVYFSTRKKKNPYRCEMVLDSAKRLMAYTCGHNPWLEARFCHDVIVAELPDGTQIVSWQRDSRQP
jgi:hypothetical protein